MAVNGASHNPMQHQTGPEFANAKPPTVSDSVKDDILKAKDARTEGLSGSRTEGLSGDQPSDTSKTPKQSN